MADDRTENALILLEELLCEPMLPARERRALRQLTALRMQDHASSQERCSRVDGQVVGLLILRWLHHLEDDDADITFTSTTEPFDVTASSLASVLRMEAEVVERSVQQLAGIKLLTLQPSDSTLGISFMPMLSQIASDLTALLYRDLLDRHGLDLHYTAEVHLERIGDIMAEMTAHRPGDPRVGTLRSDYNSLKGRATPDELLELWSVRPKPLYAWLADLAAIEERLAILSKFPDTALAADLGRRSAERILIVSGRFVQHAA